MQTGRGLVVDELDDGGVRVRSCDWPFARWIAVACLLVGLALVAWSASTAHWVELGGGLVFCAVGVACVGLAWVRSRDLEIHAGPDGARIVGACGAGPFRHVVSKTFTAPARLVLRPFPIPAGAPELPGAGGDLVLAGNGEELVLASRAGPGWDGLLDAARARVIARIPELRDEVGGSLR